MAQQGAYRTAAARASQYRLELDHLKHSRDNAMRREHELERALDEERHRSSTREAELKRNLRNSKSVAQRPAPGRAQLLCCASLTDDSGVVWHAGATPS